MNAKCGVETTNIFIITNQRYEKIFWSVKYFCQFQVIKLCPVEVWLLIFQFCSIYDALTTKWSIPGIRVSQEDIEEHFRVRRYKLRDAFVALRKEYNLFKQEHAHRIYLNSDISQLVSYISRLDTLLSSLHLFNFMSVPEDFGGKLISKTSFHALWIMRRNWMFYAFNIVETDVEPSNKQLMFTISHIAKRKNSRFQLTMNIFHKDSARFVRKMFSYEVQHSRLNSSAHFLYSYDRCWEMVVDPSFINLLSIQNPGFSSDIQTTIDDQFAADDELTGWLLSYVNNVEEDGSRRTISSYVDEAVATMSSTFMPAVCYNILENNEWWHITFR